MDDSTYPAAVHNHHHDSSTTVYGKGSSSPFGDFLSGLGKGVQAAAKGVASVAGTVALGRNGATGLAATAAETLLGKGLNFVGKKNLHTGNSYTKHKPNKPKQGNAYHLSTYLLFLTDDL